jgi:hypothetical protein
MCALRRATFARPWRRAKSWAWMMLSNTCTSIFFGGIIDDYSFDANGDVVSDKITFVLKSVSEKDTHIN